jgi:hypothetical protein
MTGNSHGWQQVSFDLSDYAGKRVKVFISYVTDPFTGGPGVFVDDTRINVDGSIIDSESFETGLGSWTIKGSPAGSPEVTVGFRRAQSLFSAAVTTPDSVLLGFGVEQLATKAERAAVLGKVMNYLLPYR